MPNSEHFREALSVVPTRDLEATLVRQVQLMPIIASSPIDFLFTSGRAYRYNPRGVRCVYFAEDEMTAAAEYVRHNAAKAQPFATYFAEVRLRRVIDLCDPKTVAALGLRSRELHGPWVGARRPTAPQILGSAVSQQTDISAIRFPSDAARSKGFVGANLVIFRDCVHRPDFVHILGPTKKPLQKWP